MERWLRAVLLGLFVGYVVHLFSQPSEEELDPTLVFQVLDKNGDGFLSLEEFLELQPVAAKAETVLTIYCLFTPLLTDTMDQDLEKASITLKGLLDWQAPFRNRTSLSREDIKALLPSQEIHPGDVWYMVEPEHIELDELSTRYTPTIPSKKTAAHTLHKVLSMFHPNVFIQTRFNPRGTVATVRAQNSEFLDIVFRCHAEFQLNRSPLLPFWFTPAQFMGRLIVARNASTVVHFNMSVPSDRKLNVDMEWGSKLINGDMEVDIGFIPQMKLEKIG
ncbi:selenoprotein N isoform X2 [Anabrus simplex]|uniref:selenoprotein N isoform X2 n=1 Tax=Anabrus simplex TaxID=316456 RepID=UPI0035A2F717